MNIFVINSGSSSIKYQLIRMPEEKVTCSGIVESIGSENAHLTHKTFVQGEKVASRSLPGADHAAGLKEVAGLLTDPVIGVINDPAEITAVGHRVVHGGENFSATVFITEAVKQEIRRIFPLAPLHNPSNYLGIEVAERIFDQARQIAVFDTAFHLTMPAVAYRYAIPGEFYVSHKIRAYGFHGTSHKYVSESAARCLGTQSSKRMITAHLGNGCSMAAIENGRCLDTSMGFGPLDGLIMGTRSGRIDPSVIFHLVRELGYNIEEVTALLNKKSGMLGLAGHSDMRDVRKQLDAGDKNAALAYDMYTYRIRKYIGAFSAVLKGLDVLVFTGGVGENDALVRRMVTSGLEWLGIVPDLDKNELRQPGIREIQAAGSRVKVLVVPTNEELEIAKQCHELINSS